MIRHSVTNDGYVLLDYSVDFSPSKTFCCGQCFRFEEVGCGLWRGVALGKVLELTEEAEGVLLRCSEPEFNEIWRSYFDLDFDYAAAFDKVTVTDYMAEAAEFGRGIRILRQDFWEALCSFIISQCNNIPRIKGIIGRLCEKYGEPLGGNDFAFPAPDKLASLDASDIRELGAGYRAPFIINAARVMASGTLNAGELASMPYGEAKLALTKLDGVGDKVACCVMLYGLHRIEAFPIDVWMRRALDENFPKDFDAGIFGDCAGIAQQYIYHYARRGVKR